MQSEDTSTKGECSPALTPAPAPDKCAPGNPGPHVWRQVRVVVVCIGAVVTLILAALVIISVYDYWPRASLRPEHARAAVLGPNSMTEGQAAAAAAAARGGYDMRRQDVARMPFLVNSLQDDRTRKKTATSTASSIPRPFFFRPSGPTAGPFRLQTPKSPLPRAWIESYRSAQRLKNLKHVVHYLQRHARAQVADLAPAPSERIAFTAIWNNRLHDTDHPNEPSAFESSGSGDPLHGYRPHHPGDVNLLAEEPLRFSLPPADTVAAASFRRIRFPPRRICYGLRCSSCNTLGDHFHAFLPQVMGEADRVNPSLFNDITPEERASSMANRKVVRPSFLPKPRFRPKATFLSNSLMLHPTVRPLDLVFPNGGLTSRFQFDKVTTLTTMSPPIHSTTEQLDYSASASNDNIDWHSKSDVSMTSPSLNSLPSSFIDNTLTKTTLPLKPFLFHNILNPTRNANHFHTSRTIAPSGIPNEPEILKFKAEDAKIHKNTISTTQIIENRRDNLVESVTTAPEESNAGPRIVGEIFRNERHSTTTYAPPTTITTIIMTTTVINTPSMTTIVNAERSTPQINGHYRSLHTHFPPAPPPPQNSSAIESHSSSASENQSSVTLSPTTTAGYGGVEGTLRPKYIAIDRVRHRRTSTVTSPTGTIK